MKVVQTQGEVSVQDLAPGRYTVQVRTAQGVQNSRWWSSDRLISPRQRTKKGLHSQALFAFDLRCASRVQLGPKLDAGLRSPVAHFYSKFLGVVAFHKRPKPNRDIHML